MRFLVRYELRRVSKEIGVAFLTGCFLREVFQNRAQQGGYILQLLGVLILHARSSQSGSYKDSCIGYVITGNFRLEPQTSLRTQTYSVVACLRRK